MFKYWLYGILFGVGSLLFLFTNVLQPGEFLFTSAFWIAAGANVLGFFVSFCCFRRIFVETRRRKPG